MKISKKIMSTLCAIVATISVATVSVSALTAGFSDYGKTETKKVADVTTATIVLTDTTTGTTVDVPKTALPAGVTEITFAAKKLETASTEYKTAAEVATAAGYSNFVLFDLKLLDQNNKAIETLNGKIKVTLKVEGDATTILYYNSTTGKVENLGGEVKNGFITFETDHFSYYMQAKTVTTDTGDIPKTSDNTMTAIIIFAAMGVVALGTTIIAIKVKKAK